MAMACTWLEKEARISSTRRFMKESQGMHLMDQVFMFGVTGTMVVMDLPKIVLCLNISKLDNTATRD